MVYDYNQIKERNTKIKIFQDIFLTNCSFRLYMFSKPNHLYFYSQTTFISPLYLFC